MSTTEVMQQLEALPAEQQDEIYLWLRTRRGGLKRLAELADKILPRTTLTEEEILALPRVRPSGF